MSTIDGTLLGIYLLGKKRYKTIIFIELILLVLGLILTSSGISEKVTYERLQTEGIVVTATCYSKERVPLSGKKHSKRSYWEWEYGGKYYSKDVVQTTEETQLAEIGKTCKVYIDQNEPNNYIMVTENYKPSETIYLGITIVAMASLPIAICILLIIKNKKQEEQ